VPQIKSEVRKANIIQYYIDNPGASIHKIRHEFKPISLSRLYDIIEEYHISVGSDNGKACAICKKKKLHKGGKCLKGCAARQYRIGHRIELNCSNCGKKQIRLKSDINWNIKRSKHKVLHVFCSSKCLGEYLSKIWEGEANSEWWKLNQDKVELL
jgi:hypothetical protein